MPTVAAIWSARSGMSCDFVTGRPLEYGIGLHRRGPSIRSVRHHGIASRTAALGRLKNRCCTFMPAPNDEGKELALVPLSRAIQLGPMRLASPDYWKGDGMRLSIALPASPGRDWCVNLPSIEHISSPPSHPRGPSAGQELHRAYGNFLIGVR